MKKKIFYSTVAALMIFPAMLMAEEPEEQKIKTLDEVVVTATRASKDIKRIPANVTVISAEEIADSSASNIIEILESQANIHIRTFSGNPSQAQIDLRGFGENGFGRTLILLDGRKLNRPDMSSINWTQLPLEQIERIEVVRGSGSVLYGDAAVAGVIHIITKKGALEPILTGSIQIGEDGFHDERLGIIGSSDKLSYSVNASNQNTDGWRDRTAFKSYGGGFQLGYDISDRVSVSGGASYNQTNSEMPNSLTKDELAQDRTQSGYPDHEAENEFQNVNFLVEGSFGNVGDFEINLVHGISELIADRPTVWNSFDTKEQKSVGVQPKYILSFSLGSFMNELVTGFDIYRETLNIDSYTDITRTNKKIKANFEKNTLGWYIRDEISIGESLILSGGGRIERSEIKGELIDFVNPTYNYDDEKEHDGEVFELSTTWSPNNNTKVYARFSTVYRYPFIDEHASYFGATPWGTGDYFNPDLEAEEGKSFEAGFAITPLQDISIGVTLFQIDMEDEISWNGAFNENLDDTRHRGIETLLDYNLKGVLDLQLNYTYQETTFEAGLNKGNDIPLVPNHLLNATLDLTLPHDIHLIPSLKYVDESYLSGDNDNNAEKLNNYTVVDLLLRHKKEIGNIKFTVFLGVNNIFDEEFSTFGIDYEKWFMDNIFYPSPGRKFYGGISGTF
ncbi:TonB-dependent receptor [Thermodesulfobacteriota bacterium]